MSRIALDPPGDREEPNQSPLTLFGGAGFLGSAIVESCRARGRDVVSVDRFAESQPARIGVTTVPVDLLTDDVVETLSGQPLGPVALAAGNSDPRSVRPWELVLDNAATTARVLPLLVGRHVTVVSSVEIYGTATAPQHEQTPPRLPLDDDSLRAWNGELLTFAGQACPPWRLERLCRRLVDADATGRWVYAMAKRAQELLVADAVPADRLTVLRVTNLFGLGQDRVVARLTRRAMAGLPLTVGNTTRTFLDAADLADAIAAGLPAGVFNAGTGRLRLPDLATLVCDELGLDAEVTVVEPPADDAVGVVDTTRFEQLTGLGSERLVEGLRSFVRRLRDDSTLTVSRVIPIVTPPRPERPELLAERICASLWTGSLKDGPWTRALTRELRDRLELPDDLTVLLTSSGTAALRLATVAVAGPARPGQVAVLPSFTFAATGEYLAQLGYRLRFCDVHKDTWTMDPARLEEALASGDVGVVVAVDALGAPADYEPVTAVCRRYGVPVVGDSAPSLGGRHQGRPLGSQADAHAFSMSFAKVVSAAGGGGVAIVATEAAERLRAGVDWTRSAVLSEVHAAVALDLVERLDELAARRRAVAQVYAELERADPRIVPQQTTAGDVHAWVHWVARFRGVERNLLAKRLEALGVGTRPYYAPVLHRVPWCAAAADASDLPVTEALRREALALPMSSELSVGEAERVFWSVLGALNEVGDPR